MAKVGVKGLISRHWDLGNRSAVYCGIDDLSVGRSDFMHADCSVARRFLLENDNIVTFFIPNWLTDLTRLLCYNKDYCQFYRFSSHTITNLRPEIHGKK